MQNATCPVHQQPAKGTCTRCGTFTCAECGAISFCPTCASHALPNEARARRAQEFARGSWMAFVISLGASAVFAQTGSPVIKALMMALLWLLGLGAGIGALVLRRGTNAPKVLAPAIVGIVLNALGVGLFALGLIAGFMAATRRR